MKDMIFVQDRSKKYPDVKEPRVTSERKTLGDYFKPLLTLRNFITKTEA